MEPENPKLNNVIKMPPQPDFTDGLLHGQARATIDFVADVGAKEKRIEMLQGKIMAARFMGPKRDQVISECIGEMSQISGQIVKAALVQILEGQIVVMHAIQHFMYPASPRVLVVDKQNADDKRTPEVPK